MVQLLAEVRNSAWVVSRSIMESNPLVQGLLSQITSTVLVIDHRIASASYKGQACYSAKISKLHHKRCKYVTHGEGQRYASNK